ncbi:MAG: RluA family pseudouridine synthase [Verrucomicrobiota bacterium]|mgnify:CR=1|nr:RluA family pseudouridine synthase [Verrucomicrobiota bacterium]|tara:strand:- start:908 stop:1738 length:831 start_codon:yes stop_codon:yes gene_type:complete
MKKNNFTVNNNQDGKRLFIVVSEHLSISKKQSQKIIDEKLVLINKKRIWMRNHNVKINDHIEILSLPGFFNQPKQINIIWKDEYYIIANKPPGLISNAHKNSLENILRLQEKNSNIVAVHRLDKETSGCIIFSTSKKAKQKAIPIFKENKIIKIYRGISIGKFPNIKKEIKADIDGFIAKTKIKVLDSSKNNSFLEIQIETGRTHQIRKHLAANRYPILGDKKYAGDKNELSLKQPRQMLHAYKLIFNHPYTNEKINVKANLPNDFKRCLNQLKLI